MPLHLPRPVPRRTFLGLLGASAGAGLLGGVTACGEDATTGGNSGDFQIWVLEEAKQNEVQNAALERFNSKSSVKARLVATPNDGYRDKLQVAMGTPQAPDLFYNWGGGSIRSFARDGMLVDLTPTLNDDQAWKDKFVPTVLDAGTIDGKNYGIPMRGMQPIILFHNKQVFADAGVQPPTTWTETLALVDRFAAAGIVPFALAGAVNWTELMWLEYLTDRIGGAGVFQRIAEGDQSGWRDPAIAKAVDAIRDLLNRGAFGTNFTSVEYTAGGASTLFAQGKAAMHLMGSWEVTNQHNDEPEFAKSGLGFGPFPVVEDGAGDPKAIVGNPANYVSVSSASKNVDAVIEFLKQEVASDATTEHWLEVGDTPAVAGIESKLDKSADPEFAKFSYGLVREAPTFQLSWDQAIERRFAAPMLDALTQVFLGQLDAEGFVKANEAAA
jgi:xylobiose transport system substrate-binding protein